VVDLESHDAGHEVVARGVAVEVAGCERLGLAEGQRYQPSLAATSVWHRVVSGSTRAGIPACVAAAIRLGWRTAYVASTTRLVLVAAGMQGPFAIVEGHTRATAYALIV
jgi:hypothetical protein